MYNTNRSYQILGVLLALFFLSSADNKLVIPSDLLQEVSSNLSRGLSSSIADGLSQGLQEGAPAVVNATTEALKNQFETTGDGHKAISNIFRSVGDQFDQAGEGRYALRRFLGSVGDEFAEGSVGRRMALNTAETTSLYIRNVGGTLGSVITSVAAKNALITIGGALGVATMWFGSKVLWNYIERQLQKPQIILETSYKNVFQRAYEGLSWLFSDAPRVEKTPMVFGQDLQNRLEGIIKTTKNIHESIKKGKKNVKYRNLLLYGPPGTGKTLFAKKLAHEAGMEFAMASGASFTKKGALEAMDELFAWAHKSNGLLLFIDEAEALMPNRQGLNPDSDSYRVFTNFLNYTGTRSNKFMIVLATNRLNIIDEAMHRRIDDLIELPLPGYSERVGVLLLYRETILCDEKQNGIEFVRRAREVVTDAKIEQIAAQTEGLSNGDLEGIINMIKTDADAINDGLITAYIVDTATERMLAKFQLFNKNAQSSPKDPDLKELIRNEKSLILNFLSWMLRTPKTSWIEFLY
jgi:DNA polymerase III delta prime subunit